MAVFDIPLLAESGHWPARLDAVAVVDCTPETQLLRTMARSGLDRATVQGIMASQASRAQRRAVADIVVCNDTQSLQELQAQADRIAAWFGL